MFNPNRLLNGWSPTNDYINRFSAEGKSGRHAMAHMPFGWGRRSCIGSRLALMEAKMALVSICRQYKLVEGPETQKVSFCYIIFI